MPNSKIIDRLSQHILTDGFHVVVDTQRSYGSWVVDVKGKRYLDCYSQFASQPLGWNHPTLVKAQKELGRAAMHKLANSDMYSKEYLGFVEKFAEITPDFYHYFFIDGGTLGVENALKAAFDWKAQIMGTQWNESEAFMDQIDVIHFTNAFHGRSGYTLSLTNTDPVKTKWFPKFNWTRVSNIEELEGCMHHAVAAIIVEPIQGEGGDIHFPPTFFKQLRSIADEYYSMLIFDEVQTGMGSTGKMWAYEHFGVVPDMLCFGKKTQVCGFCSTKRIDNMDQHVFNTSGRINSTWGGNIVDMVRFCYIIDTIQKDNLTNNAHDVGTHLLWNLRQIHEIDNTRGRGLMIAFDLESPEERDKIYTDISKKMLVLKCGEKSIRLRPALTFSKEEADLVAEYIQDAVSRLRR